MGAICVDNLQVVNFFRKVATDEVCAGGDLAAIVWKTKITWCNFGKTDNKTLHISFS